MEENKGKKRPVDDAGIRLAPTPIRNDEINILPSVRQDYIIAPYIEVDEKDDVEQTSSSTLRDYQPKKEDISKKWTRSKRAKNMITGAILFVITSFALLPYILAACGVTVDWVFNYIPKENNAILNFVNAFKDTAALGWKGTEVGNIWLNAVPDMLLIIGIIALIINFIKSVFAILGAVKQVRYIWCSFIYFVCVAIVFIISLVGVPAIGVEKIDFINDFIKDCANSELFSLMVTSIGYFIVCFVIHFITRDRQGYLL